MCAIIAWTQQKPGLLTPLDVRNMIRTATDYGPHSIGLAYERKEDVTVFKRAVHPEVVLYQCNHRIDTMAKSLHGIAHVRYATVGDVTSQNAHPFVDDNLIYCHNGTISNYRQFGDYAVDSLCLGPLIKEHGLGRAHGSVGVAWLDVDDNVTLNVYRHSQFLYSRTFWHRAKRGFVTVVASRLPILEVLPYEVVAHGKLDNGKAYGVEHYGLRPRWVEQVQNGHNPLVARQPKLIHEFAGSYDASSEEAMRLAFPRITTGRHQAGPPGAAARCCW